MLVINELIDSVEEIDEITHNVERINSVGKEYGGLRQESKTPT